MTVPVWEAANNRVQWFIPLLTAMLCVVLCRCLGVGNYMTNDDTSIQDFLSGQYTGSPFFSHPFIHIFLSRFISGLYTLFQGIEWWYLYSQGLMVLGMMLINFAIAYTANKKSLSVLLAAPVMLLIDFCLISYPLCRTSFTVVPAVLGTGAIALFLAFYDTKGRIPVCAGCYILFIMAFCHRGAAGEALICYCLVAVLGHCMNQSGKWYQRAGAFLFAALLLTGTAIGLKAVNRHYQTEVNGEDFLSYNSARSEYMDYPHDSYEQNPEIYEQVGWSRETAWLVEQWCFMDEHVTADSFKSITQNSRQRKQESGIGKIRETFQWIQGQVMVRPAELFWTIVSVLTLAVVLIQRHPRRLIMFLANTVGTIVLILYQLYGGRILYRTMLLCFLPSCLINLILFVKCVSEAKRQWMALVLIGLLVIAVIPVMPDMMNAVFNSQNRATEQKREQRADALGKYAEANPGNIYVRDTKTVRDLYPYTSRPINLIEWGKPDWNSAANRIRLEANGIEKMTGDIMKRPNAFFVAGTDIAEREGKNLDETDRFMHFYFWLKQEFGATGIRQVEKIWDNLFVYQFIFTQESSENNCYDILDDGKVIMKGT